MQDVEALIQHILYLEGVPNMQRLGTDWSCSIFNVTDQGFDGGGILISGDLSRVV